MIDVYEFCPELENEKFVLRLIENNDCDDLLKVYSDKNAVPFFNGDNCNGDDFYYATKERMKQAVDFWIFSYRERYFVRWVISDKSKKEVIGTIELFHRDSVIDAFDNCGLLRLDLRSDFERTPIIADILGDSVTLISAGGATAHECKRIILENGLENDSTANGRYSYFVTDSPSSFEKTAKLFLQEEVGTAVSRVYVG